MQKQISLTARISKWKALRKVINDPNDKPGKWAEERCFFTKSEAEEYAEYMQRFDNWTVYYINGALVNHYPSQGKPWVVIVESL